MEGLELMFIITEIVLYTIIIGLALLYSLPILCNHRLQHRNNIFTLNVCLATTLSCLSWLVTSISPFFGYPWLFAIEAWPWLHFMQIFSDMSVPFSFVLVSFQQCCSIVYPQIRFFRTKRWICLCFVSQWILAALLAIPDFMYPRWVKLAIVQVLRHTVRTSL